MAVYLTQSQLLAQFGEANLIAWTDRENTGMINADVLNNAIGEAANLIGSYITKQLTEPLPQDVVDASPLPSLAGDIWRYKVRINGVNDEEKERYDDAIRWLDRFAQGRVSLPIVQGQALPTRDRVKVPSRPFASRIGLDGY